MHRGFDIVVKKEMTKKLRENIIPVLSDVRRAPKSSVSNESPLPRIFPARRNHFRIFRGIVPLIHRAGDRLRMRRYRLRVALYHLSLRYEILQHPASPLHMLKPSRLAMMAAVVLGVVMTHTVERLVGGSASADTAAQVAGVSTEEVRTQLSQEELMILAGDEGREAPFEVEILSQFIDEGKQDKFEAEVRRMVAGYPIESMLPFILEKDRITATFLIGIAKKESNWGRRVPVLDGQDCFNYWGFREKRRLMGTGGHTCFNGKKDAVDSVAKRIENLIYEYERDTPKEMIIWKCGYSCAGHSPESVRKWIADVEGYYNALNDSEKE